MSTAFNVTVWITGGAANGPGASAGSPTDFSTTSGTRVLSVNIPVGTYDGTTAGSLFSLPVTISNDTTVETLNKDIQFAIQSGPAYTVASNTTCGGPVQSTSAYTIVDDDAPLSINKSFVSMASVNGSLTQYDITYTIAVKNSVSNSGSGANITYSLTDVPNFGSHVAINSMTVSRVTTGTGSGGSPTYASPSIVTSAPWTIVTGRTLSGSATPANRGTDTYTVVFRYTINPGSSAADVCSGSSGGLRNTANASDGTNSFTADGACQNIPTPVWVQLTKSLPAGRSATADQFEVRINSGGVPPDNGTVLTTGTNQTASTAEITVPAGNTMSFSEAKKTLATSADSVPTGYRSNLVCTNATSGSTTVLPSGSGTDASTTRTWSEFIPQAGDQIACTITNSPPTVTATKTASPNPFLAGGANQNYQISVTVANGPTTAPITIADTFPTGITLASAPTVTGTTLSGCTTSAGSSNLGATCALPTGLANGIYNITIPVTVTASAVAAGGANTANLSGGGDPACTSATGQACDPSTGVVPVVTPAAMATTKALTAVNGAAVPAGYLAKPGDVLTYTLNVNNTGGTTGSTTLTETVPAGTSYSGTAEGWSCTATTPGGTCTQTVNLGAGASGAPTFTVSVAKPGTAASIVNTATSSAGSCASCTVTTVAEQADMQASVTGVTTATTNTSVTLTSTCTNAGPQVATNASCTVTGSATTVAGSVTTCVSGGVTGASVASLAVNATIVCTTTFTPTTTGTFTVSATAAADQYDDKPGNNTSSRSVVVNTPAALNVVKTLVQVNGAAVPAGYAAQIGDKLTYDIAVSNTGGTAGSTNLTETVPAGTSYLGTGSGTGEGWSTTPATSVCTAAGSTCTQSVSVAAQVGSTVTTEHAKFTVEVLAPMTSANITNTVASDAAGSCTASNCTATTPSVQADMQAISGPSQPVTAGVPVSVTSTCVNNGTAAAVNASCVASGVPADATNVTNTCNPAQTSASLASGATLNCTITFTPATTGPVTITTTASSQSYDPTPGNNIDSTPLTVNTPAAMATTKALTAVNGAAVPAGYLAKPGDVLTYTLNVNNTGGTVGSTTLTETVPAGTSYSGTSEGWSCTATTPGGTCTQSVSVGAGASIARTFTVSVAKPGTAASIVNTATSSAGNCASCTVTTVAEQADMQASVTGVTTATTNTSVTLTSTCTNAGPQVATNASCTVTGSATTVAGSVTTCVSGGVTGASVASLAVNATIVCTTTFTPTTTGTFTVSATAAADQYDDKPGNNTSSRSVVVNTPAALDVVKTLVQVNAAAVPTGYAAQIGDKLTYDIAVSNTGGTAGSTTLTETVPAGTSYLGTGSGTGEGWSTTPATSVCTAAGSTCTQSVSVAAQAGSTVTTEHVRFTVEVLAPMTSATISNTVASDAANNCTGTNCTAVVNSSVTDVQAVITQFPTSIVVGDTVTIVGVCSNNSPILAVNGSCELVINTLLKATMMGTCEAPKTLNPGDMLTCTLSFPVTQAMSIDAVVTARTDSFETNLLNNTQARTVQANTASALNVVKSLVKVNDASVPSGYQVKPGDKLTYQLSVTNAGGTAGSTDLTETVPAGTTYVGSAEGWSAAPGPVCAAAGSTCTQTVPVAGGATVSVQFSVKVDSTLTGASVVNTVSSSAAGSCGATCSVTTPSTQADVQVSTPPTVAVSVGSEVVVTSTCLNAGPADTTNVRCEISGAPATAVTTCTPSVPVATLASGQAVSCTTRFTPTTAGSFSITTKAVHDLYDPNLANNSGATAVTVGDVPAVTVPVPVNERWALFALALLLMGLAARSFGQVGMSGKRRN
ncbi:DUF11 domain-containing protein [Diaphorobacter sp. HDW4B]|uniref:beta strand repeat-containing protein n=1 Tax=Diaphorobacter sp. HDW4B TaxID=2714925 RepID=UPI00140C6A5C|nr:DUF11 domain-containing protein [Diaphorobacter sp. HDW4B]QIL69906.1 DUF11 domain-containing protein [Diaphorobacter sp. HDW4B]